MTEAVNDDVVKPYSVSMARLHTARGSSVSVGYAEDSDNTFIEFRNNQGTKTKLMISAEATKALRKLLKMSRGSIVAQTRTRTWELVVTLVDALAASDEASAS